MNSGLNTLDKLIKYYEQSSIDAQKSHTKISGINNFNNVETADRKLIINNKLEFWVHDNILNNNCNYFLNQNNNNKNNSSIKNYKYFNKSNSTKKNYNDRSIEKNSNSSLDWERKSKNKKYKIKIQIPNTKRNIFTKHNSKDLCPKFYRKIHNRNYNAYHTISTEKSNLSNSSFFNKKIKKKLIINLKRKGSYIKDMKRNNKNILNKSSITEDIIKIQRLKEIIKQRKAALTPIDVPKLLKDNNKSPFQNKNLKKEKIFIHTKRKTLGYEINNKNNNNYVNTIANTNIITKKNNLNTIKINYRTLISNKKKLIRKNINNINKNMNNNISNNNINNNISNNNIINNINNFSNNISNININNIRNNNIKNNINNNINSNSNINKYNNINENGSNSNINITGITIINKNEYDLFFDILLWMYTKDIQKLKKFSKNFDVLLNLLSLANFLKMKKLFYKALLTNTNKNFNLNFFNSPSWSRNKISFYALEKIVPLLNGNYNRIYSLISWLKPVNINKKQNVYNDKIIKECLHSKDFFLVRNYIKKYKLIYSLSREQIINLKNKFNIFVDCLDMDGIFNNYILSCNEMVCLLCNQKFNSVYQLINENKNSEEKNNNKNNNIDNNNNVQLKSKIINGQYKQNNQDNYDNKRNYEFNPNNNDNCSLLSNSQLLK